MRFSKRRRSFSRGRKALAVCDRSGFVHRMSDMVVEPGTNLLVYKGWSDGKWNRVDHPLNFPADVGESVGLKNPRVDIEHELPLYLTDDSDVILTADGHEIYI